MRHFLLCFVGLMVSSAAHAADRWPAETCKHLQEMKSFVIRQDIDEYFRSAELVPILIYQRDKCGVDNHSEIKARQEIIVRGDPNAKTVVRRSAPAAESRRGMNCMTTALGGGDSTTTCF